MKPPREWPAWCSGGGGGSFRGMLWACGCWPARLDAAVAATAVLLGYWRGNEPHGSQVRLLVAPHHHHFPLLPVVRPPRLRQSAFTANQVQSVRADDDDGRDDAARCSIESAHLFLQDGLRDGRSRRERGKIPSSRPRVHPILTLVAEPGVAGRFDCPTPGEQAGHLADSTQRDPATRRPLLTSVYFLYYEVVDLRAVQSDVDARIATIAAGADAALNQSHLSK